jgi:hypothetical protein
MRGKRVMKSLYLENQKDHSHMLTGLIYKS